MMDWNYLILGRIKKILNSISSIQNLLSSTQKLIGTTTDIGGSQTAGTMMAKENAILDAVGDVMKEIPKTQYTAIKLFSMSVSGSDTVDGDGKPFRKYVLPENIRVLAVQGRLNSGATGYSANVRLQLGKFTTNVIVADRAEMRSYFSFGKAFTEVATLRELEDAVLAATRLNNGLLVGSSKEERDAVLTLSYVNEKYHVYFTVYYVENA